MIYTPHIAQATVSIGWAAFAAGFSKRGLRFALGTGHAFPMLGQVERPANCWRRFSVVDVVRLAILSRLVNHGFTVSAAAHVIASAVDPRLSGLLLCGVEPPRSAILDRLAGAALFVSMLESGDRVSAVVPDRCAPTAHDTTLVINLGDVAALALSRLPTDRPYRNRDVAALIEED